MHTKPMQNEDGVFAEPPRATDRRCPRRGEKMTCRSWDSNCGGHTDYEYACVQGHVSWTEGADA